MEKVNDCVEIEELLTCPLSLPTTSTAAWLKTRGGYPHSVFDLISAHTPISTVKQFQFTARVLFVYFFTKTYVVGTYLNCIDLSMQFTS